MCMLLFAVSAASLKEAKAAEAASIQMSDEALSKNGDNSLTISLKDNTRTIAGIEIFIAMDTELFTLNEVQSLMSGSWEFDWKEKANATYGSGIHCMLQNAELKGITAAEKDIINISFDASKAEVGKSYNFEIYVIDICDEQGDSLKASVSGDNKSFQCVEGIPESQDIQVLGFQISPLIHGFRTVSAVEPEIDGKEVVEFGHVYAIVMNGLKEQDVYVGSDSLYVKAYAATENSIVDANFTESATDINYVVTMINNGATKQALEQKYMVRAYAKLSDGTYIYSDAAKYTIYNVAEYLYKNILMPNLSGHEYLYNNILTVVDSNYKEVDYDWNSILVKP